MAARRNVVLLAITRVTRMFAYGALSVILALHLARIGFDERAIGVLFTLTLAGDAVISLLLTTVADRVGRRRVLIAGALLMLFAGVVFASTTAWPLLVIAAIFGVVSPTGNEIGPFLSVEQAALAETVAPAERTRMFAWYQAGASFAGAAGALAAGVLVRAFTRRGVDALVAHRYLYIAYAAAGAVMALAFALLSRRIEPAASVPASTVARRFGLHRSRRTVLRISALFALDSFGGGFVLQTLIAYWFHLRFGADEASIGAVLFACNLVAGMTSLGAAALARRIGLVRTMVVTHLPSNVLLCLVPVMPNYALAVTVLILRFSISQMDVPTRQSYVVAVVDPDERSAAAGITTIARSLGAAASPALSGMLLAVAPGAPFVVAGGLKIVYDVLLFKAFSEVRTPEERPAG
jgi:MFS family permease